MTRAQIDRAPYVEQIGEHFRDLPSAERQAVLDDVATHLNDAGLAADDLEAWVERFGPAAEYARQLRADLGLGTDPASLVRARRFRLRHARLRTRVLLAAAALAGCAVLGLVIWTGTVQPLSFQDRVDLFGGRDVTAGSASEHQWSWTQGGRFATGTWLHNDGAVPVRVTGIDLQDEIVVPWDNWRVTVATDDRDLTGRSDRPFTPFTLDPGERRLVWFRGDFDRCPPDYETGGGLGISDVDVTFKMLGVTRHHELPLGFTYSVIIDRPCR